MKLEHHSFAALALCLLFVSYSYALYEDEVGKDDWYYSNLGPVKQAVLKSTGPQKSAFVASHYGVVARLNLRGDGTIQAAAQSLVWRQILPDDSSLKHLQAEKSLILAVSSNRAYVFDVDGNLLWDKLCLDARMFGDNVVALSAGNKVHVLSSSNGKLLQEFSISTKGSLNLVHSFGDSVYFLGESSEQAIIFFMKYSQSGQAFSEPTIQQTPATPAPVPFSISAFQGQYYIQFIYSSQTLFVIDITSGSFKTSSLRKILPNLTGSVEARTLATEISISKSVVISTSDGRKWLLSIGSDCTVDLVLALPEGAGIGGHCDGVACLVFIVQGNSSKVYRYEPGKHFPAEPFHSWSLAISSASSAPFEFVWTDSNEFDTLKVGAPLLLSRGDWSLSSLDAHGQLNWRRFEALSNLQNAVYVDLLPTIHVTSDVGILSRLVERIASQLDDIKELSQYLLDPKGLLGGFFPTPPDSSPVSFSIKKDRFGLHQMIVAVTGMGNNLIGIHTARGQVVWESYFQNVDYFEHAVLIRRSVSEHPELLLAGVSQDGMPIVVIINPLTGAIVEPLRQLPYGIQQVVPLSHLIDSDDRHPVLIIDMDNQAHVFPESRQMLAFVAAHAKDVRFYLASKSLGVITGFVLIPDQADTFLTRESWRVDLSDSIHAIQQTQLNTYSAARVNPSDKTVSLRHLNPNLIAVATVREQTSKPSNDGESIVTHAVNVAIMDSVSGNILHRSSHKDCAGPVHLVFTENWVVYQYWNERANRFEVSSLELFDSNGSWGVRSLDSFTLTAVDIRVQQQSFVMQSAIKALGTTVTAHGITEKTILFGLSSGHLFALSRKFLDPRRPDPSVFTAEDAAEGLIAYSPVLPQHPAAYINYYNTVQKLRGFVASPAALESTSLVLAYGLDVFFTPVAPNNRYYDRLTHGFNTTIIFVMIVGLAVVTWVTMRLYRSKELKKSWK